MLRGAPHPARLCATCVRRRAVAQVKKDRKLGKHQYGWTARVIDATPKADLEKAMQAIRAVGRIAAAYPVIGKLRCMALSFYSPAIRSRMRRVSKEGRADRRFAVAAPAIVVAAGAGSGAYLYERASRAVPSTLPRDMRDDVIGEMVLAVLEGRLLPADVERRAAEFVRASFRADHNKWGDVSLDWSPFSDGAVPLIERVTTGLW